MSGYYPPNQHIPPQFYNVDPNLVPDSNYPHGPPMISHDPPVPHHVPGNPMYHGVPGPFVQYGEHPIPHAFMEHYEEAPGSAQGPNARARRRSAPGDQVKHRRTRSGCFTCRQRRVKCDEAHPICERCRKGNRECVYPEPSGSKSSRRSSQKSGTEASSPEDQDEEDSHEPLATILDDEEDDLDTDSRSSVKHEGFRAASDTPSLTLDRSPSPSTESSSTMMHPGARPPLSRKSSGQTTRPLVPPGKQHTLGLPQDVRFYLDYFKNHMSHHHYNLKRDTNGFLMKEFLPLAVANEPLRYAVVGYAAYFHTLGKPDGRISNFLQYYNESVSRLRASIEKKKKQGLPTFLTILQLASIEEALGDWVNLMGHQKAAYEILTRLYTPQTILQTELLRKVLLWYIRFDLYVGFQSGGESTLGREWYVELHDWYAQQSLEKPDDLSLKYEERFAHSRLVAKDSADLFAKKAKGLLTDEQFMEELPKLSERVYALDKNIDPVLLDPCDYVKDLPGTRDPENIVNPYEPNVIWGGSRWTSNYLLLDMYGIIFMFQIQVAMALRRPFDPDLPQKALRTAQVFEAVCQYPKAPPGAIIEAQSGLAIAVLFLPKDPKTIQWCRRRFANIEASGYIYSNTMRNRMLDQWGMEHSDWWLPNDEDCPPIIRSIKDFIHERTTAPKDQTSEDLREMRGVFSTLTISDSPPSEKSSHTPIEGVMASGGVPTNMDETLVYTGGSPDYDWNYESSQTSGGGQTYSAG